MPELDTTTSDSPTLADEMRKIAYQGHYQLCAHYSSLIFQARVAITTVAIVAVAVAVGALPTQPDDAVVLLGLRGRALVALLAAVLINLLHSVEISYLSRFCHVVAGARVLERGILPFSYFQIYRTSYFWPLQVAYFLAVALLASLFANASWAAGQSQVRAALIAFFSIAPLLAFAVSYVRLVRTAKAGVSADTMNSSSPQEAQATKVSASA